jgi:hypothetical protein
VPDRRNQSLTTYNEIGFTRSGAGALRSDVTDDEPRGKVVIALT